ncbi:MAG: sugar transferase, partial [Alphaproteobacteria bacterium]
MIRLFKHYVPHTVLFLGLLDFVLLVVAAEAGWILRLWQISGVADPDVSRLPHLLTFAVTLQLAMVGVGAYGADALQSMRVAAARLVVAVSLGVLLLALIFFLLPTVTFWRSNLLYAMIFALTVLF